MFIVILLGPSDPRRLLHLVLETRQISHRPHHIECSAPEVEVLVMGRYQYIQLPTSEGRLSLVILVVTSSCLVLT
jgi:hypothetical protein